MISKMELIMSQIQISLDEQTVAVLDNTAMANACSREDALKEAIYNYASYDQYLRTKVEKGLLDITAGNVLSCEEVDKRSEIRIARLLNKNQQNSR